MLYLCKRNLIIIKVCLRNGRETKNMEKRKEIIFQLVNGTQYFVSSQQEILNILRNVDDSVGGIFLGERDNGYCVNAYVDDPNNFAVVGTVSEMIDDSSNSINTVLWN